MADQVFYEIARWRLDEQLARVRELNARLMTVLSGATVLLVLFAALQDFDALTDDRAAVVFASTSVGVYVALLLTSVVGYRNPDLLLGYWPDEIGSSEVVESQLRRDATFALHKSVQANASTIRHKSQVVFVAVLLWAIDSLLLLATAITLAH